MMSATLHILMVEDSPDDAKLVRRELEESGYEIITERVDTEGTLREALARYPWDVVLCDFTMPRFSGPEALAIVSQKDVDLPFIYVSGTMGEDVAVEAVKSGAQDYVLKSSLKRLGPAIQRVLRESQLRREHRLLEAERERLIVELQAALAQVKLLSGLLPICAGCKHIRNDHDAWEPIEGYLMKHSEAKFSHGLCPDCIKRIYGSELNEDELRVCCDETA